MGLAKMTGGILALVGLVGGLVAGFLHLTGLLHYSTSKFSAQNFEQLWILGPWIFGLNTFSCETIAEKDRKLKK